ncbi:hypothetical protein AVEN_241764-1 [Araneus ventricosus]|uniref:Uncharacterized protein n=1 Tax=Araneus ventricosus TaxID=182803 RepID=A0A4Y2FJG7_ARAVE|nr:hypothetical protein AVEN_241764-1 [Araneus ventricosus]
MSSMIIENGKKVIQNVKGGRQINQELRKRQTRVAESFASPRIEISSIEQLGARRKKKATLSPIEIRTLRTAPGAALTWRVFLNRPFFAFSQQSSR